MSNAATSQAGESKALSAKEFIEGLVARSSVSGEETLAAQFAVEQMQALGYRKAYLDDVGNAIGVWGAESASKRIMLVGHIDTVKGAIETRIEKSISDAHCYHKGMQQILHGRGSVDAKGPFATFVHAVSRLAADANAEIIVVGAVEEESHTSRGARQILSDFSEPAMVIIGEPSHTTGVTLGYKGRLVCEFSAERPMSHSAHEHLSAAELAIAFHLQVKELVDKLNKDKHGIFEPLDYTIQSLNTGSDGLKEVVRMNIGFRLGPSFSTVELEAQLGEIFSGIQKAYPEFTRQELSVYGAEPAAKYDKNSELARAFRVAIRKLGAEPRLLLKTGTSDMNVLAGKWTCPMLAYGPGDSALDHTPEEHLSLKDYRLAINVLEQALFKLMASAPSQSSGSES